MIRQSQVPDVDGAPRGKDDMSLPLLSIESRVTTGEPGMVRPGGADKRDSPVGGVFCSEMSTPAGNI